MFVSLFVVVIVVVVVAIVVVVAVVVVFEILIEMYVCILTVILITKSYLINILYKNIEKYILSSYCMEYGVFTIVFFYYR